MEYCCQVWVGAPSYYSELLDKLQKWICRTVGPPLAASFETLVHLTLLAQLVQLPYSQGIVTEESCSQSE